VSFWATYCSPCIEKFPLLNEIAQSNESLEIIMISDEKTDLLKTFLQHREDISELHFLKHQGKNADIGINLLPTTLFVENGIHKIISNKDLESFLE
jgi:thiol-disulfide isomerase/thioredoxin